MLVRCQVCDSNVSDQAAACPKCGSEKSAFLGPESYCYECGAAIRSAYQSCMSCGAPRSKKPASSQVLPAAAEQKAVKTEPLIQPSQQRQQLRYETVKPAKNSSLGRLLSGFMFTLVAIVVGVFVSSLVRETMNQQRIDSGTVSIAELEKSFSNSDEGRLFEFIKAEFPDDYEEIMNRLVTGMNAFDKTGSEESAFEYGYNLGAELMEDFMNKNGIHIQTAPDAALLSMGLAQEGLLAELKTRDPSLCAAFARGESLKESDKARLKEMGINIINLDIVVLAAISAGKKRPHFRTPATDSDWEELMSRVSPALSPETFDELLNTDDPLQMTDKSLCDMTSAMMSEIMNDTPERQAMWIASMHSDPEPYAP